MSCYYLWLKYIQAPRQDELPGLKLYYEHTQ